MAAPGLTAGSRRSDRGLVPRYSCRVRIRSNEVMIPGEIEGQQLRLNDVSGPRTAMQGGWM